MHLSLNTTKAVMPKRELFYTAIKRLSRMLFLTFTCSLKDTKQFLQYYLLFFLKLSPGRFRRTASHYMGTTILDNGGAWTLTFFFI